MQSGSDYPNPPEELLKIRKSLDNIDIALIHILAERFKITDRAGQLKAEQNLAISDRTREQDQVKNLRQLAMDSGLEPDIAEKFINLIVAEALCRHKNWRK